MESSFSTVPKGGGVVTDELANPFDLVKATDLSDAQIADYFVDFPGGASLVGRIRPTSPMPMIIFGGKGSGKTHLMRYLSYQLLGVRARDQSLPTSVSRFGYLGMYFRCGGLNAQRFEGKGQAPELWQEVFAYYMELWLGQVVLSTLRELYVDTQPFEARLVEDALRLLDVPPLNVPTTLDGLGRHLEELQRATDIAINNAPITRDLPIRIQVTRGSLIFGLPQLLARHCPDLGSVLFVYLVDEFENLTAAQQKYFNTLVRERKDPCTFKIGVRLYGLRSIETLSAGEENRENSEYEALRLDSELRARPMHSQKAFATALVEKRLNEAGYKSPGSRRKRSIESWFEIGEDTPQEPAGTNSLVDTYEGELPHVSALRAKLTRASQGGAAPGLHDGNDAERIINLLRQPGFPFVERTNVFLLYRAWSRKQDLSLRAREIADSARQFLAGEKGSEHDRVLRYFRADILAQLLRETKQRQRYLGFDTFVRMSGGLPRGLLTILKHVFTWARFYGEQPFRAGQISVRAQAEAVLQAEEWFFSEARAPGAEGQLVRGAMTRLGQLLRELRFSDKPSECSLSTFSADLSAVTPEALKTLRQAVNWSLLVQVTGGQHERNLGRVDEKFQVHPMLAPRWDLPTGRRGALGLSGVEVSAIFAPRADAEFDRVLHSRLQRMTAPFFGKEPLPRQLQRELPGLRDG